MRLIRGCAGICKKIVGAKHFSQFRKMLRPSSSMPIFQIIPSFQEARQSLATADVLQKQQ